MEIRARLVGGLVVRRLLLCKRTIRPVAVEFMKTTTMTAQTKSDAITTSLLVSARRRAPRHPPSSTDAKHGADTTA